MKPFTTTRRLTDGREVFEMQIEGAARAELLTSLYGDSICGISLPKEQSCSEAWFAKLSLSSGRSLEITSSSTSGLDWKGIATINLRIQMCDEVGQPPLQRISFDPRRLENVMVLDFSDDKHVAEAGVVFELAGHPDLIAMAGEMPGSFCISGLEEGGEVLNPFSHAGGVRRPIAELLV